jgi:hypothetical protein
VKVGSSEEFPTDDAAFISTAITSSTTTNVSLPTAHKEFGVPALTVSSPNERLRIVVLGYIVRGPLGGLVWHHLQYVMGLARLGHEVVFIEDSDGYPSCYDPSRDLVDTDPTYGLAFATNTFDAVGLGNCWAYHDAHLSRWLGPRAEMALKDCAGADLLLNLSAVNPLRSWHMGIPTRVLVDTDPVFTQIHHLIEPAAAETARRHTAFFSFGENIETGQSMVPDDGFSWLATRQPMVLDAWPVTPVPSRGRFTTVMQWDSYGSREFDGCRYGMKSDSFAPYEGLPKRVGPILELALGSASAPRDRLTARGWHLRNPLEPTRTPWSYQSYIRQSRAEFGVAKQGYVASRSGWFSERSAAYLASGRPVVVQDTGFSHWMDAQAGVLPFRSADEAVAGIEEVLANPQFQGREAREIARAYFDSEHVLGRLLERSLETPHGAVRACPAPETIP